MIIALLLMVAYTKTGQLINNILQICNYFLVFHISQK
jgi:hypothetical protein